MFIFVLTYQKPLEEVEKHLQEHRIYLDTNYQAGHFIASGRQEPRIGGVILCRAQSKEKAQEILAQDPFFIHQIAKYDVIEFVPTKYAEGFDRYINI
jgi:uncharacterized protein YciI